MNRKLDKKKVVLGLSGGVDSTAAALLLLEKGYQVTGLYFDIMPETHGDDGNNMTDLESLTGRRRAELAAEQIGIDFLYKNVSSCFNDIVIGNFCREYAAGRTPNPCIICNPAVKFRTLLEAADERGAYYIATGHYADTYHDAETDLWYIRRAANEKKDQSYMLYRLEQEAISRLLLPLNGIGDKEQVRELAREKSLHNAEAKDSQEICFIDAEDDYKAFLQRRGISAVKGDFVDASGNVLGEHQGILHYTIGQRKGLGVALGKPAFVTKIDGARNQVVLGDNEDLFCREVYSSGNILFGKETICGEAAITIKSRRFTAKIRYTAKPADAIIEVLEDGRLRTTFEEPQRAATPGQSIVFYSGDLVIGGGFIEGGYQ